MSLLVQEGGYIEAPRAAGRYRIEAKIASGGMGAVYRAFDAALKRSVALKRLIPEGDVRQRTRMFEREFHTLAGLKHPRIIEVFDYGIDEQGAYYTMELLDGRDLRELAPLPYKQACLYLRDVASSLALLHARNLLHRDLSPRNVRVTSDGRAKLIDFGTLCGFGRSSTIVGTAPCLAPESLERQALDQRADLYGLGALAYWLLVGRHAFEVRAFNELPDAWRKPLEPPSERLLPTANSEPIPAALDELVISLLSQNPLARPASAAEVIAQLSAIAELEPDKEPLSALSYLQGGKSVGRTRERARLRKRLKAALAGAGSSVMMEAQTGMGSARILGELAIEARLSGATAVVIDAGLRRGTYAVAEELARALLTAVPDKARAAMAGYEAALERFATTVDRPSEARLSSPSPRSGRDRSGIDPREARLRTQAALLGWIQQLLVEVPLLIAVHNFQKTDEGSAAFFAALARDNDQQRLLLAFAHNPDEEPVAPAALQSLREGCSRIHLRGLSPGEVRAWVESSFGQIDQSERLADWLHETTGGNPKACHDLMQHLIEQDVIRFAEGVWALPNDLAMAELPSSLDQALGARLERVGVNGLRLLAAVAVHRGPMPLERCVALAEREKVQEPLKLLADLEQRGLLTLDEDRVLFSHSSLREYVQKQLTADQLLRLHAALGRLLATGVEAEDDETKLDAGWHLLHGGQERRGAELLAEVGLARSYDADKMPEAIPALRAALEAFRKQGRSKRELAKLLGPLALAGYYSDREVVTTYAEDALRLMAQVLGVARAAKLRPWLGARFSLVVGMLSGIVGFVLSQGPRKGLRAFQDMVPLFVSTAGIASTLGIVTLDRDRALRYIEHIKPLTVLGPDSGPGLAYQFVLSASLGLEDRLAQALVGMRRVLSRLEDPRPIPSLPEGPRLMMYGGTLYTVGAMESFREDPAALVLADRLEALGLKLFEMFAHQIRCNYHGVRGEIAAAEHHRKRVELIAVQAGSGWQAELWAASSAVLCGRLTGDLVRLRRALARVEQLANEIPSLRRQAKIAAMAYLGTRGEKEAASKLGDELLASSEPRSFIGWGAVCARQVSELSKLGNAEQARSLGLRALSHYDAEDRKVTTMITGLVTELALAECALSDFAGAALRIDNFLAELGERGGPATRGGLHEARVRIAQQAGDMLIARLHLSRLEQLFRATDNPALIARCERLRRNLEQDAHERGSSHTTLDFEPLDAVQLRELVRDCAGPARFERVLELLLEHTGGKSGWLCSYEDGELVQVAACGASELPAGVLKSLRAEIALFGTDDCATAAVSTTASSELLSATQTQLDDRHRTFLLCTGRSGRPVVVAAAAITLGERPLRAPLQSYLMALADGLTDTASQVSSIL